MYNETQAFKPLSLKPHWMQFTINQLPFMLLDIAAFVAAAQTGFIFQKLCALAGIVLALYLLYQIMYLARMEYIVTGEQIIFLHGVVNHATDYMELYRVIDYQQSRTLMQQLAGLKTVTVYSGDRNTPVMALVGIRERVDVVAEIRKRVEYNKKMNRIYEVTNRY